MTRADPRAYLPRAEEFLLWPPTIQPWGYRIVDKLFAHRVVKCGAAKPFARDEEIAPVYMCDGVTHDVAAFMDRNFISGLLVLKDGAIVLERYGLGLEEHDRWSTMSTIKSMTAMLVGAAVQDGAIASIDRPVTDWLPELQGSAYADVTLRHLLTMSSGVRWNEDYADRNSDVNRYSKSMADRVPGGVLKLMRSLPRENAPGTAFLYNSGDTFLLGAALTRAVGIPLADYMSARVWRPVGMERDAFYTLESEGGQEIGGSRAGMVLRDFGRFAQFVLDDGVVDGRRVLPEGWVEAAATPAFVLPEPPVVGVSHYGYSWWLGDGFMSALGFAGQRIDIFRRERLAIITLAAFPQAPYAPDGDKARRAEVVAFTTAVRRLYA